jgi:hypothetical protein
LRSQHDSMLAVHYCVCGMPLWATSSYLLGRRPFETP